MKNAIIIGSDRINAEGLAQSICQEGYKCEMWIDETGATPLAEQLDKQDSYGLIVIDALAKEEKTDVLSDALLTTLANDAERTEKCLGHVQTASRYLAGRKLQGSIVIVTSFRGFRARPGDGAFGGSYALIHRAVESFAIDLAKDGIRINCVAAGILESTSGRSEADDEWVKNKIPLMRIGTMADIAQACAFLGSEEASYITGITIRIDGGLMLSTMPDNLPDVSAKDFVGFDYSLMKKTIKDHQ